MGNEGAGSDEGGLAAPVRPRILSRGLSQSPERLKGKSFGPSLVKSTTVQLPLRPGKAMPSPKASESETSAIDFAVQDPQLHRASESREALRSVDAGRSRSRGRGSTAHVERSIEATLADAEPAANVRSRKSSHYLGLFKEQDDRRKNASTKIKEGSSSPRDLATAKQDYFTPTAKHHGASGGQRRTPGPQADSSIPNEIDDTASYIADSVVQAFPPKLLEEIRKHHNLTPGAERGTSFSRSIPTTLSERSFGLPPEESDLSKSQVAAEKRAETIQEEPGEEDESDKEQISSALYYPHAGRSSEVDELAPETIEGARLRESVAKPEDHGLIEWHDGNDVDSSDHVDISLQSRDQNRHLHGDIQRSPLQSEEAVDFSYALSDVEPTTASESEYESGYDTALDDPELTPTATPRPGDNFPTKITRRKKKAPSGAVELKPYSHQVGGHTTMFRFSQRAVCKTLSNRENEFYERIERRHPDMLRFLPR